MVHALKMGWMKPSKPLEERDEEEEESSFYMIWNDDEEVTYKTDSKIYVKFIYGKMCSIS